MKKIQMLFVVCSLLLLLFLEQCTKVPGTTTTCHVCTPKCVVAHITNPGGGTSTSNYCGNGAQVASWEASILTATAGWGGSAYFSDTATSASGNFNVCASNTLIADSLTYYKGLGYSCN